MTLVYLAAAWTAGIVLAKALHLPWQVLPLVALFSFLSLLLWRDNPRIRLGALCAVFLILGAGRFLLAVPRLDESSLATYNEVGWVALEGVVVAEPDVRDTYTNLRVRADRLTLPDGAERAIEGLVLVKSDRYPPCRYGDRVRVEGLLETPPVFEDFSYRDYLARRGVYSMIRYAHVSLLAENQANPLRYHLYAFKRHARETIAATLPEPQAALLTGILLGVDTGIPEALNDAFATTGTTHIIAISGFNITIVAGIFTGLAVRFFDRRRALWVAIVAVALYTLFVGASAAVVRAAFMGLLYLFARYVGRESFAPVSLAAAVIGMTAWDPHTLWDVGFLLSLAATAGLLVYTEPLERCFERVLRRVISAERAQWVVGLISDALIVTLAAQLATMPILLHYFGRLSLVTLLANFLILPFQPAVMIWGGAATLLGLVIPALGRLVGWVAWVFLAYTIEIVRLTAQVPRASVPLQTEGWMVWAYYILLGGLTWWLARPREQRQGYLDGLRSTLWGGAREWRSSRLEPKLLFGSAAILLVLALVAWRSLPDGRLHIAFLDVGQGDAILIETPAGRQVLIDGGPSPSMLLSHLGRRMPFWDRSLDLVVLTHPESDHITGLVAALERYQVDAVVWREMGCQDPVCDRWRQLLAEGGATLYRGEERLVIALDEGLRLEVLHPGAELLAAGDFNDDSIVMRLSYGEASVLLTGDITALAEQRLLASGAPLASTVLKAPHHGSCSSATARFLEAVDPEVIVISVGENDFGHPCGEVLERLGERAMYRTDDHGTVELITDGARLWVETEHPDAP